MTTFISSRLAIAFSSLVLVGSAAAEADEGRTCADLLTTQQLAASAIAQTDHVTLQQHFLTIAAQNDAQAAKHAAMAQAERDNPNPGSHFPGSAALRAKHCDRLAESSRELAQGARAAASEHELMATAIAQGDHATQQRYFVTLAGTYDAEAARHADMAQGERKNANRGSHFPGNASLKAVKHCDQLSTSLQAAAKEARERAAEHARMANSN